MSISCDRIWTGAGAEADTVLFDEGGILAVGRHDDVASHPSFVKSKKYDLPGKCIIPGLMDYSHRLLSYSKQKIATNLSFAQSKRDMAEMLLKCSRHLAPDDWICAYNLNESYWDESSLPDCHDLDALKLPNPILIQRYCGHVSVVNGRALEVCGLANSGSTNMLTDEKGSPTGVIVGGLQALPYSRMSRKLFTRPRLLELLRRSIAECASYGLTSLFTSGLAKQGEGEEIGLYRELRRADALKVRVSFYLDKSPSKFVATGSGDRWVNYQGVKLVLDGVLGVRTAALSEAYSDAPGEFGRLFYTERELTDILAQAREVGSQAFVHTIGDAALDLLMDASETVSRGIGFKNDRYSHVVANHCQVCRPDQIQRLKRLGIAASIQPAAVEVDRSIASSRLGDRVGRGWTYVWKDMINSGLLVCGSIVSPTESIEPWDGVWAAVNRQIGSEVWQPNECLTLEEALTIYTKNPAVCSGTDDWRGTLEQGKCADLVVLDRDIFTLPKGEREEAEVRCTIAGGGITHGSLDD